MDDLFQHRRPGIACYCDHEKKSASSEATQSGSRIYINKETRECRGELLRDDTHVQFQSSSRSCNKLSAS
jgi:hypothetical protein